jgi:PLP dependent protein
VTGSRRDELSHRLTRVREQIASAAEACGRGADDVVLVVVTKTWPTSDIEILHDLGVRDVAENRHQDAERKWSELRTLELTWHFIGQIQSNKASRIAAYADVVHSVDSVRVARRLAAGADQHRRQIDCLVQVSLDPATERAGRGGVGADDLLDVAEAVDASGRLHLRGVMGVAPLGGDAQAAYAALAGLGRRLQSRFPAATAVSAGMSGDFTEAIAAGATHVRVGSAILGERPALR